MSQSPSACSIVANRPPSVSERSDVLSRFHAIRQQTEALCRPLAIEDYGIQTMPDVSPPKWHIAHVSWFFETFLLIPFCPAYQPFHPAYDYLFNSYYLTHGQPFPRPQRGLLSRPTVAEVYLYRSHIDAAITRLVEGIDESRWQDVYQRLVLGLHHEQQHQELLLTDIKHILAFNPLRPRYRSAPDNPRHDPAGPSPSKWVEFSGGVHSLGHAGQGFCFDNETPRHQVYLNDFALSSALVNNGDFLEFIASGGYQKPDYWLSDGWTTKQQQGWEAPLYWEKVERKWWLMTLSGMQPLMEQEPVCHISFYEADAFARWAGKRLPSEAEWELAASSGDIAGNLLESNLFHPRPPSVGCVGDIDQLFGDVWEWTSSPYAPYPGFRPLAGSLGEYNGKFMCNQMVLRGGSCATPAAHIRPTYRNFFFPGDRWQFSGIRLADNR